MPSILNCKKGKPAGSIGTRRFSALTKLSFSLFRLAAALAYAGRTDELHKSAEGNKSAEDKDDSLERQHVETAEKQRHTEEDNKYRYNFVVMALTNAYLAIHRIYM